MKAMKWNKLWNVEKSMRIKDIGKFSQYGGKLL